MNYIIEIMWPFLKNGTDHDHWFSLIITLLKCNANSLDHVVQKFDGHWCKWVNKMFIRKPRIHSNCNKSLRKGKACVCG